MMIQRWIQAQGDSEFEMWRDPKGTYVLFADHEAELQAQRAVLAEPVTDDEWKQVPGHYSGKRIPNLILAARAAKLDKKPEPDPLADLLIGGDTTRRCTIFDYERRIREAYERGRKAVHP